MNLIVALKYFISDKKLFLRDLKSLRQVLIRDKVVHNKLTKRGRIRTVDLHIKVACLIKSKK